MNKVELVDQIATKSGLTKKDSETALKAFMETIKQTIKKGEKIQLIGFGSFEPVDKAAREGRNPRTKEIIQIPAKKAIKFSAGKELKNFLNPLFKFF